jgi:hypothetical protein
LSVFLYNSSITCNELTNLSELIAPCTALRHWSFGICKWWPKCPWNLTQQRQKSFWLLFWPVHLLGPTLVFSFFTIRSSFQPLLFVWSDMQRVEPCPESFQCSEKEGQGASLPKPCFWQIPVGTPSYW